MDALFSKFSLPKDPTTGYSALILYRKQFPHKNYRLLVRPMCLETDIPIVFEWVNKPYSQKFWGLPCTRQELFRHYFGLIKKGSVIPFIIILDRKEFLYAAQMDVYQLLNDELGDHFEATPSDYGVHLLMAPYRELISTLRAKPANLSREVLLTGLGFLFSSPAVGRVLVEPDQENAPANTLARDVGFRFIKKVSLSYKEANLYCYKRSDFLKEHP